MKTNPLRTSLFALAVLLVAAAGPVGTVFTVLADGMHGYHDTAAAWCPTPGRVLCVSTVGEYNDSGYPLRTNLVSTLIDPVTGTADAPVLLTSGYFNQKEVAVAWNPSVRRFLAVFTTDEQWNDGVASEIHGLVLDEQGLPVGGISSFNVSDGGDFYDTMPCVACDGARWMVAWKHGDAISGRRVLGTSTNGSPGLAGARFEISDPALGADSPAIAFGGSGAFLVVWQSASSALRPVTGRVVSSDERMESGDIATISGTPPFRSTCGYPSVAANPGSGTYLVSWVLNQYPAHSGGPIDSDPVARLVDGMGNPLADPVTIDDDPERTLLGDCLSASWNAAAGEYLVCWREDGPEHQYQFHLRGARLGADSSVVESGIIMEEAAGLAFHAAAQPVMASHPATDQVLVLWREHYDASSSTPPAPVLGRLYDFDAQGTVDPPTTDPGTDPGDGDSGSSFRGGGCLGSAAGARSVILLLTLLLMPAAAARRCV